MKLHMGPEIRMQFGSMQFPNAPPSGVAPVPACPSLGAARASRSDVANSSRCGRRVARVLTCGRGRLRRPALRGEGRVRGAWFA